MLLGHIHIALLALVFHKVVDLDHCCSLQAKFLFLYRDIHKQKLSLLPVGVQSLKKKKNLFFLHLMNPNMIFAKLINIKL